MRHLLLILPILLLASCHLATPSNDSSYLHMPTNESSPLPPLLSQTGAFANTQTLTPAASLISYDLNAPFYSDNATKRRWFSLPTNTQIHFSPTGPWSFPNGTVFIKHFEFPNASGPPLRVETRILVRDDRGFVYGATYRWRPDNSDADLVTRAEKITLALPPPAGPQDYYLPGPKDCRTCHTPASSGVLGVNTRQLNRDHQLQTLAAKNLFDSTLPTNLPHLVNLSDTTAPLETRIRSWLDANCAQCHRPGTSADGAVADFDARFETPLAQTRLLNTRVRLAQGIDNARIVSPHDPARSMLLLRTNSLESTKMPPLGRQTIDTPAVAALREWIESLPGPTVLPPPTIAPPGTESDQPLTVTLSHPDPAATIHYTLDGSTPNESSPTYDHPLRIDHPTILRAAAFKPGATRSLTVQEVFSINL